MSAENSTRPNSKVARVIETYGLDDWGDRLEREWTGEEGERTSLRDLADAFNRAVLKAALQDAGGSVIEADVESTYRTLTGDGSRADRLRKERELDQAGVDVDRLRSDFVTHQAIHTYLTDYRGAELPDESEDRAERKVDTLERLQGRTAAVAESTLDALVSADEVSDHEYELFVELRVVCEDCGTDYAVGDLIRRGGCDCG